MPVCLGIGSGRLCQCAAGGREGEPLALFPEIAGGEALFTVVFVERDFFCFLELRDVRGVFVLLTERNS